jgi:hypothetical protein
MPPVSVAVPVELGKSEEIEERIVEERVEVRDEDLELLREEVVSSDVADELGEPVSANAERVEFEGTEIEDIMLERAARKGVSNRECMEK